MGLQRSNWDGFDHPDIHGGDADEPPTEPGTKLCREMASDRKARAHYTGVMQQMARDDRAKERAYQAAQQAGRARREAEKEAKAAREAEERRAARRASVPADQIVGARRQGGWAAVVLLAYVGHPAGLRATPAWMLVGGLLTALFAVYVAACQNLPILRSAAAHPVATFRALPAFSAALVVVHAVVAAASLARVVGGSGSVVHCMLVATAAKQALVAVKSAVAQRYARHVAEEERKEDIVEAAKKEKKGKAD
eukprot:Rhum_TRINITY_DN14668_c2_g1::Rhum_TRINITY_DN14668_c2_g1_i1::g.109260::m.109260